MLIDIYVKLAFKDYVTACLNDRTKLILKSALEIVETEIIQNSPRLTNFENFKTDWKSRLSYAYNLMPKQDFIVTRMKHLDKNFYKNFPSRKHMSQPKERINTLMTNQLLKYMMAKLKILYHLSRTKLTIQKAIRVNLHLITPIRLKLGNTL